MKTLAVVNQKGGCGKTTVAVNLAACLSAAGERVLLVDMDPQGHAAMALGIGADGLETSVYNVLTNEEDDATVLSGVLVEIEENLWLAPANILLSAVEQQLAGQRGREDRLRKCLAEVVPSYDFCIIDSPPSVGLLTMNALRAAQVALIPIDMSQFSLQGTHRLLETISVLCSRTAHSIRARVVANVFDSRTNFSKRIHSMLSGDFGEILCKTVIHRTVKLAEGAMHGLPIRKHAPYSAAHEDFADLALEIATDPDLFNTPAPFPARVLFSYFDPSAHDVKVVGDFNDWFPSEHYKLMKQEDGKWSLHLPLNPGRYKYKFIVDGQWREDPANPNQETGEFNQKDSVLDVN
jgi:chromosome partitioning protein